MRHLVHIGYHKTASTWFQKVYYPQVANGHFVPRKTAVKAFVEPGAFQWRAEQARALLPEPDGQRLLICEEELSGYLHNGGLCGFLSKEVAGRLHQVLPEADIVIFIRNQPDMVAACYAQYIRGGGTFSVNRYLHPHRYLSHGAESRCFKIPRFSFDHLEYWPLIRHYRELFGPERVHVFPFEALRDTPDSFLQGYAARFGLEVCHQTVQQAGRRNRSYSFPIMQLARLLNLFTRRTVLDKHYLVHLPYWYSLRRKLLEGLNRLPFTGAPPSPEALLGPKNLAYIRERYRDSNRAIADACDLPLADHGYPL